MKGILRTGTMAVVSAALLLGGAGAAAAADGPNATGVAVYSPGVLSGNNVQVPIGIDANLCGNSVNVIGALNPAAGNVCVNG